MKIVRPLPLALACALALSVFPAHATPEKALTKLNECMALKAASPEQQRCLAEVEALRKAPAPKAAQPAAAARTAAPPVAMGDVRGKAAPPLPVPAEVKTAAAQLGLSGAAPTLVPQAAAGASISGVGSGINPADIKGMDLESAMMIVQSRRAELLESQLKTQMEGVKQRNDDIAKLNKLLGDLKALRPAGADPKKWANLGANREAGDAMYKRVKAAGVTMPTGEDEVNEPGTGVYDARQTTFDAWNQELKGKMEELNGSQQMDMLKMQSLANKRNEAFDLMTNFLKKMAESRSSIIGNMR